MSKEQALIKAKALNLILAGENTDNRLLTEMLRQVEANMRRSRRNGTIAKVSSHGNKVRMTIRHGNPQYRKAALNQIETMKPDIIAKIKADIIARAKT